MDAGEVTCDCFNHKRIKLNGGLCCQIKNMNYPPAGELHRRVGWQAAQQDWPVGCTLRGQRAAHQLVGCRSTVYSYFDFGLKNSNLRLPYQRPSSSADCAGELFNGSASLVDCSQKIFGWGLWIVRDWRHKWSSFRVILACVAWPRAQPLVESFSLKFTLETRLESKSFEPLIDFLAFLVQKLWSKINKLIN